MAFTNQSLTGLTGHPTEYDLIVVGSGFAVSLLELGSEAKEGSLKHLFVVIRVL